MVHGIMDMAFRYYDVLVARVEARMVKGRLGGNRATGRRRIRGVGDQDIGIKDVKNELLHNVEKSNYKVLHCLRYAISGCPNRTSISLLLSNQILKYTS
jgi:hypothetical protein